MKLIAKMAVAYLGFWALMAAVGHASKVQV